MQNQYESSYTFHTFEDVVPIGFTSSTASVSENDTMVQLEIGVMDGHFLEVEVDIIFTTVQLTAEGTYTDPRIGCTHVPHSLYD
jgi:hypothetical protein